MRAQQTGLFAGALLAALLAACKQSSPAPAVREVHLDSPRAAAGTRAAFELIIAGSGAGVPLLRLLAARFEESHAGARVHVASSIGSSGAVRALDAHDIDIGIASQPLGAKERARLVEVLIARSALVFVAHARNVAPLAEAELVAIYRGARRTFPSGEPLVPLARERGDSGNRLLATAAPALASAIAAGTAGERLSLLYTDQEMLEALGSIEGALGYVDLGSALLAGAPLKVLPFAGITANTTTIASGQYPLTRTFSLLLRRGEHLPLREAFVAYVCSPAARRVLEDLQYVAVDCRA